MERQIKVFLQDRIVIPICIFNLKNYFYVGIHNEFHWYRNISAELQSSFKISASM